MTIEEFYEGDGQNKEPIYLNALVLGPEGCGKTRLLLSFPDPFIITFANDKGKEQIRGIADGVDVGSWGDFRDYFVNKIEGPVRAGKWVNRKGRKIKTLGVDGMSLLGMFLENWAKTQPHAASNEQLLRKYIKGAMQEVFSRMQSLPGIHTVWTCHTTESRVKATDGTWRVTSLEPQFAGYWGSEMPKQVFARLWMNWVMREEDGARVIRTYLRPFGMMNASVKRDGYGEGTPYVLPPHLDMMTFGLLADWMTVCGVPVHDAPGTHFAPQQPDVGGGQP